MGCVTLGIVVCFCWVLWCFLLGIVMCFCWVLWCVFVGYCGVFLLGIAIFNFETDCNLSLPIMGENVIFVQNLDNEKNIIPSDYDNRICI